MNLNFVWDYHTCASNIWKGLQEHMLPAHLISNACGGFWHVWVVAAKLYTYTPRTWIGCLLPTVQCIYLVTLSMHPYGLCQYSLCVWIHCTRVIQLSFCVCVGGSCWWRSKPSCCIYPKQLCSTAICCYAVATVLIDACRQVGISANVFTYFLGYHLWALYVNTWVRTR